MTDWTKPCVGSRKSIAPHSRNSGACWVSLRVARSSLLPLRKRRGGVRKGVAIGEAEMANAGQRLRGRQTLKLACEHHTLDVSWGQVLDSENTIAATLKGDKLAKLKLDWDSVLAGQAASVPDPVLCPTRYRQLKTSPTLREEVARYDRAHPNTFEKTYSFLYTALCWGIALNS